MGRGGILIHKPQLFGGDEDASLETIISIDNSDVLSVVRVQWLDVLIQRGFS